MTPQSNLEPQLSAYDPLLASLPLRYKALYFPSGFPAQIETNDQRVMQAADKNWSETSPVFSEFPVIARIIVSGGEIKDFPPMPTYRARQNLLTLAADSENFGCCDLLEGVGAAWVNEVVIGDIEYFRYAFLQGIVCSMIETRHLLSLHAACVVMDGQGILLAGDSGAGKSSLSFACARRGFIYVSDDCSSIVRKRGGRTIVGTPHSIRFRGSAAELFPELKGRDPLIRLGRQPAIEVRTAELPEIKTQLEAWIDHIVFLDRRPDYGADATLTRVSKSEARARLFSDVWPRELPRAQMAGEVVDRMLSAGIYELRYRDLTPAIDRIEKLVRTGS